MRPAEHKLVEAVIRLLKRQNYNPIFTEYQFCEIFLDVYAKKRRRNYFIAIEAKVASPSKAFKQAERYLHIADKVYVAIYKNGRNRVALQKSKETGIGLIYVKRDSKNKFYANIEHDAKKSRYKDNNIVDFILKKKRV